MASEFTFDDELEQVTAAALPPPATGNEKEYDFKVSPPKKAKDESVDPHFERPPAKWPQLLGKHAGCAVSNPGKSPSGLRLPTKKSLVLR